MTSKERVLERERQRGKAAAQEVQTRADSMTNTELYAVEDRIPEFRKAVAKTNMLNRPVGFVCRASSGLIVRLLQPYDSEVFTQEPEKLPAQWGYKWSTDPSKAQPFIASATSPYMKDECCIENGATYRSLYDNNVHAPSAWPVGWEEVQQ